MPKTNTYMLSDDYTHLEDKAMKSAAQFFGEEMLQWAGIHEKLKQVMPTELIHLEARALYQDFNYETTNDEIQKMQAVLYAFANKLLSAAEMNEIREVIAMTKLGQMILEDGIERGIERGLEKGIQSLIETCKEFNLSKQETMSRIIDKFSLPEEKAQSSIEKYWK